jgi:ribosomal protein L21E
MVNNMKMTKAGEKKMSKVMGEFKEGKLHSGKGGKVVKDQKQALAIAISSAAKKMGRMK